MTPQERELMQMALDALEKNKRTHYYCEDTWYSCPKHEDGCANDAEGDDCNCGADRINTVLDKTIKALRARLEQPEQAPTNNGRYLTGYKAQPEQEPVAWMHTQGHCSEPSDRELFDDEIKRGWTQKPLYTAPPQREFIGLTDEDFIGLTTQQIFAMKFAEAKLREKNA